MSTSRPGVATSRWQPLSRSRICWPMSAPPYTTHGRTRERYANYKECKGKKNYWIEIGFARNKIMFSDLNVQSYLPSLIIDLESQFPSWSQNQRKGMLLAASKSAIFLQQTRNQFGHILLNSHTKTSQSQAHTLTHLGTVLCSL